MWYEAENTPFIVVCWTRLASRVIFSVFLYLVNTWGLGILKTDLLLSF